MIGCVLWVGSVGAASAMDADGQDLGSLQHAFDGSSGSRDSSGGGASSGGDALGISRENTSPSGPAASSSSDNCPGTNPVTPQRNRHPNLGWQSLLPGSIQ
ncbi:hypothetical protein [Dyella sp. C9]|uniref:hypothetical protein n=1 Tax=Dyella sp. C9 TaxID=2202154 RepID=UPI0013008608|nr:hypothetical protein [Dyella sp. C9]